MQVLIEQNYGFISVRPSHLHIYFKFEQNFLFLYTKGGNEVRAEKTLDWRGKPYIDKRKNNVKGREVKRNVKSCTFSHQRIG